MAVIGSICCACGMPVEHDHYVPTGAKDMFEIYRGSSPEGVTPVIEFGPEHEWLKKAVALPRDRKLGKKVEKGFVEDGHLCNEKGEYFSVQVGDNYSAFIHEECWKMASLPESFYDLALPFWSYEWKFLEKYAEQLFNFSALKLDLKEWMLVNPSGDSESARRNRERIQQLLQGARDYQNSYIGKAPASIDELLKIKSWDQSHYPNGLWKYRKLFHRGIQVAGYEHFLCAYYDFKAPMTPPTGEEAVALEAFLLSLYQELESKKLGIHFNATAENETLRIYYYIKDVDLCAKFIQEQSQKFFGRDTDLSIEHDPEWKLFWENFFPINEKIEGR